MSATWSFNDGIAVWELIYYPVALLLGLFVSFRHGLTKKSGWIFLCIFSVIRILSGASTIALMTTQTDSLLTLAAVTRFLALAPLTLASLGLVARVYYSILKNPWRFIFTFYVLKLIQTPAAVAGILCIVGAVSADDIATAPQQDTVRAGVILFLIVVLALILFTIGAIIGKRTTRRGETKLIIALSLSLPLLFIRVIYSVLECFASDPQFNALTGPWYVGLFMATVEEALIVAIYLWAGVTSPAVPEEYENVEVNEENGVGLYHHGSKRPRQNKTAYRAGRGEFGGGRLGLISLALATFNDRRESERRG